MKVSLVAPALMQSTLSLYDLHDHTAQSFLLLWIRGEDDDNLNRTAMHLLTNLQYLEVSVEREKIISLLYHSFVVFIDLAFLFLCLSVQ